jgi:CheY-like chemotaxis protein
MGVEMIEIESIDKSILSHIPIHISILDLDLNVVWANEFALKEGTTTYHEKCYIGFNRDLEQCTFCPVVRALSSGEKSSSFVEVFDEIQKLDRVYEIIAIPIKDSNDKITSIYEIRKNFSGQVPLQNNQKISSRKVKEKEEAFSSDSLLEIVAHELNEHLEQAMKMHQKLDSQKLEDSSKIILAGLRASLMKIQNLLSNVLTLRNISKGVIKESKKKDDLKKVIYDIINPYEIRADFNSNNFDYRYDSKIPSKMVFDQTKIALLVSNILDFSFSHTSNRTIYFLTTLKENNDDQIEVSFKVDDVGSISIHDEVKKDSNAYIKTNLSLTVIRHLAESLGGDLVLKPQSGYGIHLEATVIFKKSISKLKIPFFGRNNSESKAPKESLKIFGKEARKKILVAEDDPISRITIEQILSKDYTVILAKNGKIAVEKYFEESPDLVVMDIMMPVMNGFDAFDEINHNSIKHVPIIACTSKVIRSEKEYLTSYGFDDYIEKPVNLTNLRTVIKKYL